MATLIFTTPERLFHPSMSATNVLGQLAAVHQVQERHLRMHAADDDRRRQLLPRRQRDADRPAPAHEDRPDARVDADLRAADSGPMRAIEAATAPMPPCGNPQFTTWLSPPTPPTAWCSSTYAVPGSSGPAHCPITPSTIMIVFICSDSNHRSSRSEMLIENSRITSATPRVPRRRTCHAACACASRSPGESDPTRGGTWCSSGPITSVTPCSHASHRGSVSASRVENCDTDANVRCGSSP